MPSNFYEDGSIIIETFYCLFVSCDLNILFIRFIYNISVKCISLELTGSNIYETCITISTAISHQLIKVYHGDVVAYNGRISILF